MAVACPGNRAISVEISPNQLRVAHSLPEMTRSDVIPSRIEVQVRPNRLALSVRQRRQSSRMFVSWQSGPGFFKPDENGGTSPVGNTATLEVSSKEAEAGGRCRNAWEHLSLSIAPPGRDCRRQACGREFAHTCLSGDGGNGARLMIYRQWPGHVRPGLGEA